MYQESKNDFNLNCNFIEQVVNCMDDWVRVVDANGNVLFMNNSMCKGLNTNSQGIKCYLAIGRNEPCENCITKKAIFDGVIHDKEEIINDRIFSVTSSPMKNSRGKIFASVEVLRDVTEMKQLQSQVQVQNEKLKEDLETAKKLQISLLPKNFSDENIDFSYIYHPSESLSGDFINIFRIDKSNIGVYIADVSGHGVPSSMLTVFLSSALDKKQLSPSAALEKVFKDYNEIGMLDDKYITVFYAVLNLDTLKLTYSNAGHSVIPFIFTENKLDFLQSTGIPISNWLPAPGYTDKSIKLERGDSLFLYTDGLVDLRNSFNTQFGEEKILQILQSSEGSSDHKLKLLYKALEDFAGSDGLANCADDFTMAILKIL